MDEDQKFMRGDIVRTNCSLCKGEIPEGTVLIIREPLNAGLYGPGAYVVCREDGDTLPAHDGYRATTVIYDKWMELVSRSEAA